MADNKQVILSVAGQFFGINIGSVISIEEKCKITFMPSAKSNVLGIMNLRNEYIPVYSFRRKINKEENLDEFAKVIVVNVNNINIGIKIDAVLQIVDIEKNDIYDVPIIVKDDNTKYIKHVAKVDNALVLIIELDNFISANDMNNINKMMTTVNK